MLLNRRTLVAFCVFAAAAAASHAQSYPNRPIRVVVPFPAGGGTDIIAREVTQKGTSATGWVFVVENKPGAAGNMG